MVSIVCSIFDYFHYFIVRLENHQKRQHLKCRLFSAVSKTFELVEKVDAEPIGAPKQFQTLPKHFRGTIKPGFSASEQGAEEGTKGFFNTLVRFCYTPPLPAKSPVLRLRIRNKTHTKIKESILNILDEFWYIVHSYLIIRYGYRTKDGREEPAPQSQHSRCAAR
jgi:hypothetical protein